MEAIGTWAVMFLPISACYLRNPPLLFCKPFCAGCGSCYCRDVSDEIRAIAIEAIGSWVVALPISVCLCVTSAQFVLPSCALLLSPLQGRV